METAQYISKKTMVLFISLVKLWDVGSYFVIHSVEHLLHKTLGLPTVIVKEILHTLYEESEAI